VLGQSTGFYIQELEGKSIIHVYTLTTVYMYITILPSFLVNSIIHMTVAMYIMLLPSF